MNYGELRRWMNSGKPYHRDNEELMESQMVYLDRLPEYNQLKPSKQKEKRALSKEMSGHIGESCYIETPFHINRGGKDVYFGDGVYANSNLAMVDDSEIRARSHVMTGPNVVLCSTTHPICPELRKKTAQYNLSVRTGDNVWLGANCVVLPGVTIGENSVIGAGNIVTKDILANVAAVGTPCQVVREIHGDGRRYYNHEQEIDFEW